MKWEDIIKARVTASMLNLNELLIEYLKENLDTLPRTFNAGYFVNEQFKSEFRKIVKDYVLENNITTASALEGGFFLKGNRYRSWVIKSWQVIKKAYKDGELPILVRMGVTQGDYTFEVVGE